MLLNILATLVSLLPLTFIYLWLKNKLKDDPGYKIECKNALGRGMLTVFWVILFSGVSYVLLRLTGLHETVPLLYQCLYDFIVLALMEELAKYLSFRKLLKKTSYPYSWLDCVSFMTMVSIGFSLLECIEYAIGANALVILIRGICLPHAGFGFIEGYFHGKALAENKPGLKWAGILISWLLHGLYDFSLSEEFGKLNDNLVFIPLILVIVDIILVIRLIRFAKKARNDERYTAPLVFPETAEPVNDPVFE
ncbi:MAG: PrsW family intramembrane metalloprotease [Clostridia bacterium]|nr:PrsW family intramembrane metalloprotease [Clostridia bacterium]